MNVRRRLRADAEKIGVGKVKNGRLWNAWDCWRRCGRRLVRLRRFDVLRLGLCGCTLCVQVTRFNWPLRSSRQVEIRWDVGS